MLSSNDDRTQSNHSLKARYRELLKKHHSGSWRSNAHVDPLTGALHTDDAAERADLNRRERDGDARVDHEEIPERIREVPLEPAHTHDVAAGRARWKAENEDINNLKTKGYNLEHSFGHGGEYLSEMLVDPEHPGVSAAHAAGPLRPSLPGG